MKQTRTETIFPLCQMWCHVHIRRSLGGPGGFEAGILFWKNRQTAFLTRKSSLRLGLSCCVLNRRNREILYLRRGYKETLCSSKDRTRDDYCLLLRPIGSGSGRKEWHLIHEFAMQAKSTRCPRIPSIQSLQDVLDVCNSTVVVRVYTYLRSFDCINKTADHVHPGAAIMPRSRLINDRNHDLL